MLKLSPDMFWRLSLPEWRALIAARFPQIPALERGALDQLMKMYPDSGIKNG